MSENIDVFDLIKRNTYRNKYPLNNCSLTSKKKGTTKLYGYPHHKKHYTDKITGNHTKVYRHWHNSKYKKLSQINKNEIKKIAREPYAYENFWEYGFKEDLENLIDYVAYDNIDDEYKYVSTNFTTPIKVKKIKCPKLKKKKGYKSPLAPPVSRKLSDELDALSDEFYDLVEKDYVIVYPNA